MKLPELQIAIEKLKKRPFSASRDLALSLVNSAHNALMSANGYGEVKQVRDGLKVLEEIFRLRGAKALEGNLIVAERLRAERRLGELLADIEKSKGGRPGKNSSDDTTSFQTIMADLGIGRDTAYRWMRLAAIDAADLEHWLECKVNEPDFELSTTATLKALATLSIPPHVSHNSGNNEWYTPAEYIAAARAVMGSIDLDPASSVKANEIVCATHFYTAQNSGLDQDWMGRVWMNPPYSSEWVGLFISKFVLHFNQRQIVEGIVLVNNATETHWFAELIDPALAIVFPTGRIRFLDAEARPSGMPLQGQAVVYFGDKYERFMEEFSRFGWGVSLKCS